MNTYEHNFTADCPNNGAKIRYALTILTPATIMVEDIVAACEGKAVYHEQLADALHSKFGGQQTMVAFHHGVKITTTRGGI